MATKPTPTPRLPSSTAAATIAHPGWPDPAANNASGSATSPTSAHRKPVHAAKPLSIIIELTLRQGRHSSSLSLSWYDRPAECPARGSPCLGEPPPRCHRALPAWPPRAPDLPRTRGQMLRLSWGVPEHKGGRHRRLVADHAEHVSCHAPLLAVHGGLSGEPHRAVVAHRHPGPHRHWCRGALDGEISPQLEGLIWTRFDAGDDHADIGVVIHIQERGRPQILVAFAQFGVQRRGLDVDSAE